MTLLHRLASVLRGLLGHREAEQALDEELRTFVDMAATDKMRDGIPAAEARRLAMLELGGVEQTKERVRTGRHGALLDELGRDLRYAVRMCVKSPGFTATVVMTLALGIGANTAIFSLLDALMLRWLPVSNPRELVQLEFTSSEEPEIANESFSYAMVRAFANQRDIFRGVAGFSGMRYEAGVPGAVAPVRGALVTGDYYETLGLRPAAGRLLGRADDEVGAPLAAVISDAYWERQFARRGDAVGRDIRVNGALATIVGVTPRGFVGSNVGAVADLTLAVAALPVVSPSAASLLGPGNAWLRVVARPAAGLSTRESAARVNAVWPQLAESVIATHWPASRRRSMAESRFQLTPGGTGWTYLRDQYRKPLMVLMAVVVLVLLIACANVASLMLARSSARQREMTLRLAIGASRVRIVRQLLIESTLLSATGAVCGLALAWLAGEGLIRMISSVRGEIVFDLSPNLNVLGFTSGVAVATGILFGLAPALRATAVDPATALKEDARTSSSASRLLPALVSLQVALSVILLAGAGLFVRTLQNLETLDPGFKTDGVLLLNIEEHRTMVPREYVDEVRGVPGVIAASLATHTPLSGALWSEPAVPAGQTIPERDTALFVGASPGFFESMRIPLVAGREFSDRDMAGTTDVAIVNEAYARRYFDGRNPIGERLSATVRRRRVDLEIVGVASNTSTTGLRKAPPLTVYVAYAQLTGDFPTTVVVRADGPLDRTATMIQDLFRPKLGRATLQPVTLAEQVGGSMVQERMMATLATGFGLLALALVSVGLYGLLAYSVAQRTREIGIRMALGARSTRVVAMILTRGTRLVVIGIALGLPAAWASSRWIESLLFGLTPTDPAVVIGAILLLATAAQLAAVIPARRASRVDPMVALRHE